MAIEIQGSPFVIGRPLRPEESIFGRDEDISFLSAQLSHHNSVNIVGERRIGKSSLLIHLMGHQEKYLPYLTSNHLLLGRIDLQGGISTANEFYSAALRGLFSSLPREIATGQGIFTGLNNKYADTPSPTYAEFEMALSYLGDLEFHPILVIDEFEKVFDPPLTIQFPYPTFFDGLRALMTATQLSMVIFSRLALGEYFKKLPNNMTSNFPTYFNVHKLGPLSENASQELLLQKSNHALTLGEALEAQKWAKGYPCLLQIAGEAYYRAKASNLSNSWVSKWRIEAKDQNCLVTKFAPSYALNKPSPQDSRLVTVRIWAKRLLAVPDLIKKILLLALLLIMGILLFGGKLQFSDIINLIKKFLSIA